MKTKALTSNGHKFSVRRPIGASFFCWNKNNKNYVMGGEFSRFVLTIKLHIKTKWFPGPEQSNGMDFASAVASPSSLLTPTGRTEHDL